MRLAQLLSRPGVSWDALRASLGGDWPALDARDADEVEAEVKYAGHAARLDREADRVEQSDDLVLPEGLTFVALPGLSREVQERLTSARPRTVGEARRLRGMTPAAIAILLVHVHKFVREVPPCG